jgi:FtsP/CotA-like multicopper oxidase with cupredoxin domain
VPHETQPPIEIGGAYTCRVRFPDPGLYWYHPHVREDYGLDMGLYGSVIVDPADDGYWPPVDREVVVTLDDVLIEDGRMAPYGLAGPTHVAMGRFGNRMVTAGQTHLHLGADAGEVVRFFFTNTANTRLFNVAVPGARMKLVGGDSGRYEHETWVEDVLLAPSERAIVDVLFDDPGSYVLAHRAPDRSYVLGSIAVRRHRVAESRSAGFDVLRTDVDLVRERSRLEADRHRAPDKTLACVSLMPLLYGDVTTAADAWNCPMHPEVIRSEPGTCPHCGMRLVPGEAAEPTVHHHGHGDEHGASDGLEWEDLMPEINRASDAENMSWKLVDRETGAENGRIDWTFAVGDRVKIRLENGMDQDHPMHHPFHVHGAGRFLVLARDGEPDDNLVWKDTVLVRAGQTVDILLELTNPGLWMAHCHIAEHAQAGMMFSFVVTEPVVR